MRLRPLLLLMLALLAGCGPGAGRVDVSRVRGATPGDWLMGGRTFALDHHSPLTRIDASNVGRLGLAFEYRDFAVRGRTHHGMEANPVHVDGVLYFSGPWGEAHAVDARTGRQIWSWDPHEDGQYARYACCDVVNRGVAVWKGRVYVASLGGVLSALDAKTGRPVWRVHTILGRDWNTTVTGAPHIAGRNVLIGSSGGDMGSRGYVSALDLKTGKLQWRFWSVPGEFYKAPDETGEVALARQTWPAGSRYDLGLGGNAWNAMAYDPETNTAYLGMGSGGPHPHWIRSPGGGDNYYLSSIVAVNAQNGHIRWLYQTTPGDSWDYDATQHLVLADLTIGGRKRKVILQANKNGFFYVLDRRTGELLKADPFTTVNWADRVDLKTGRPHLTGLADYSEAPRIVWPGAAGAHGWQPMSFDPRTGLVYLPVQDEPSLFSARPVDALRRGAPNTGTVVAPAPGLEGQARLKAWDPVAGRARWVSDPLPAAGGGVLTTGSGLVFQGGEDGALRVYEARTGKLLKRIETGTAIMAAPISYELDGVQYVAVLAGAGGSRNRSWAAGAAAASRQNFERLLVFKLDGRPVPLPAPLAPPVRQPRPTIAAADAAAIARGRRLYEDWCARCHARGGAAGAYPDLWNMSPKTVQAFEQIVQDGALRDAGMGAFSDVLSRADIAAIKAYIVSGD